VGLVEANESGELRTLAAGRLSGVCGARRHLHHPWRTSLWALALVGNRQTWQCELYGIHRIVSSTLMLQRIPIPLCVISHVLNDGCLCRDPVAPYLLGPQQSPTGQEIEVLLAEPGERRCLAERDESLFRRRPLRRLGWVDYRARHFSEVRFKV
jgi:hypothetical protein